MGYVISYKGKFARFPLTNIYYEQSVEFIARRERASIFSSREKAEEKINRFLYEKRKQVKIIKV